MADLSDVEWTHDCCGKQDFDADLVRLSTRYWPAGGGYLLFDGSVMQGSDARPDERPSAFAEILLRDEPIASAKFQGDTESAVKRLVEEWAAKQFAHIEKALLAALAGAP